MDQAGQGYRAAVLQAFQQVEDELARLKYLKQQIIKQTAATISAHKAEMLANYRYQNGAVTYLDSIDRANRSFAGRSRIVGAQSSILGH
ncbi:MAG: hypothetical protein DID90_2727554630 [Candidatus Nitrotoga sp. LAW]|nr:MAG: hypothetical protein DID90_2727554630 [Candidatus Nitrotoga sp. LAW]